MPTPKFTTSYLLQYVNLFQGSRSRFSFSQGNCFPLVARPFGMTHWAPQTDEGNWLFHPDAHQLQGIRATHQPSPWIGDYGHFTVMAQTGRPLIQASNRASAFRPAGSKGMVARPHSLSVLLWRYATRIEVTPTDRCAIFRFTFPPHEVRRVILEPFEGASEIRIELEQGRISGFTRAKSGGAPDNFACYFAATFNRPIDHAAPIRSGQILDCETTVRGSRIGAIVEFQPASSSTPPDGPANKITNKITIEETETSAHGASSAGVSSSPLPLFSSSSPSPTHPHVIEMKIATSFISVEQAFRNLQNEVGEKDFDAVEEEGAKIWNDALSRITVSGASEKQLRTLYSCLYRAHLFPRMFYELDENGSPVHYSPYDGQVHPGVLYTDNGFWDTYRTVYPFLALVQPERLAEILEGWVQSYREGGWFPQWASPGYRACMIGTHIDAVMADAAVRGITGFDLETAYEGMLKHASTPGDEAGNYGRIGIQDYLEKGYVSADRFSAATSRTLDYAYDDWCISQVAGVLGRAEDQAEFLTRSQRYENVFDPETGFMRGRNADGSWQEFDEFAWGGPYVEGGAWQSTWAVAHYPEALIRLMGGPEAFVARLDRMLKQPPVFEVGTYGFEIHEMTEMAAVDFGQYAHSNQPVHHVLYLYAVAGRSDRTQYWVRQVLDRLYSPVSFCGDEDNGEMSAWYILSALGLYPLCPGHPSFLFGSPLFPVTQVKLGNGKTLRIEAEGNGPENVYVRSIEWNGQPCDRLSISHQELMEGGHLRFTMSPEAATRDSPQEG